MKFQLVTLYVKDMNKALEFYNGLLDLPILKRQKMGDKELVFLGNVGNVNLELIETTEEIKYKGFSIGFEVNDIETLRDDLKQNGYLIKSEIKPNPYLTLYFLDGPNGEEIELIEQKNE